MHSKSQKRRSSPVPSRSPPVLPKAKAPAGDAPAFRIPKDFPQSRFGKAPLAVYPPKGARSKPCVSLPVVSLEKMPCLSRANSSSQVRLSAPSSSPSSSPAKHPPPPSATQPNEKLANGRGNSGQSPAHRPAPSPSPSDKKNQNGAKACSRTHNRLSGRVFDPNKHCGVQDPETKQPCTRSLTCKTHSLSHRRAVPGRRKHFNVLLAEHRGRSKEKEVAKEKDKDVSPSKPPCPNGRPLSTLKLKLANAHIPRVPGVASSMPQPPPAAAAAIPAGPPANPVLPSPRSRTSAAGADADGVSSDEGDAQTPDDARGPAVHFSDNHPQPSGFCIFSSRLMGRGLYVFDRRWDRMRVALHNMVEKHLTAQMWRKVPLAAESPPSLPGSGTSHPATPPSSASDTCPPSMASSGSIPCGASPPGALTFRDAPRPILHRPKESLDSIAQAKRNKSSYPCSFRNGKGSHPPARPGPDAVSARKKVHGRVGNGLWRRGGHWLTKADGPRGQNPTGSDLGNTNMSYSSGGGMAAAPSSGLFHYGQKAEGTKRKSTGSYQRNPSNKLSRLGGSAGDSQRQAKLHH